MLAEHMYFCTSIVVDIDVAKTWCRQQARKIRMGVSMGYVVYKL